MWLPGHVDRTSWTREWEIGKGRGSKGKTWHHFVRVSSWIPSPSTVNIQELHLSIWNYDIISLWKSIFTLILRFVSILYNYCAEPRLEHGTLWVCQGGWAQLNGRRGPSSPDCSSHPLFSSVSSAILATFIWGLLRFQGSADKLD